MLLRVEDPPLTARQNVERDDELLRRGKVAVRVARLSDTSVSLGVGQSEDVPAARQARSEGIPVVRRATGGTGLLHLPGDIVWSVVLPRSHSLAGRDFTKAYGRLGAGVVDALALRGLESSWTCPLSVSEEYCLLSSRGEVLTVRGKVLGGAAQRLTRDSLLHHGVLASRIDGELLARLFGLSARSIVQGLTDLQSLRAAIPDHDLVHLIATELSRRLEGSDRRG